MYIKVDYEKMHSKICPCLLPVKRMDRGTMKYKIHKFKDDWEDKTDPKSKYTHRKWVIKRIHCARRHVKEQITARLNGGAVENFYPEIRVDFLEIIETLKILRRYGLARKIKYIYRGYFM